MKLTIAELQAFTNDPSRNFNKIRSTQGVDAYVSYNDFEKQFGKRHTVVAHNQMPKRTYPIEIHPVHIEFFATKWVADMWPVNLAKEAKYNF